MEGNFGEILARLRVDYPDLVFKAGRKFAFRGPKMVRIPKELWVNTEKLLLNKEFADEHGVFCPDTIASLHRLPVYIYRTILDHFLYKRARQRIDKHG